MAAINIVIDDTDPRITYTGDWFTAPAPSEDIGVYGGVWNNTLHATHSNASIWVVLYTTSTTPAGLTGPSFQCFVDGVHQTDIGVADPIGPTNHWAICGDDVLYDGLHTFTVNVTASANQTAWVDFIKYAPLADVDLTGETVLVQNFSPDIKFGAGWGLQPVSETDTDPWSSSTNVTGSTMHYEFIGSSLIWYGLATTFVPNIPAPCTYSIDGGTPVSFNTIGKSSSDPTQIEFFVIPFQTGALSLGKHTLDVVYNGGVNDTPLILDYLIVQNGTNPAVAAGATMTSVGAQTTVGSTTTSGGVQTTAGSTTMSGVAQTTAGSTTTTTGGSGAQTQNPGDNFIPAKKHSNTGAIIGGVCGGLALISFIFLCLLCYRKRQRRKMKEEAIAQPHAFVTMPQSSPGLGYSGYGNTANERQAPKSVFAAAQEGVVGRMPSRTTMVEQKRPLLAPNQPPTLSAAPSSSLPAPGPSLLRTIGSSSFNARNENSVPLQSAGMGEQDVPPPMYTPD
ncbi:hypothetical protein BDN70DRAFT_936382 [Pholiota conissans]|uniref:Transmembrane protein n=1 Tax=Pholiota conissans TaxID=109636 RepID=A0A9P5YS37_9AGAR|nr:hypothetical protein BDN70DRAFT_936382 [Pholiota conissans]